MATIEDALKKSESLRNTAQSVTDQNDNVTEKAELQNSDESIRSDEKAVDELQSIQYFNWEYLRDNGFICNHSSNSRVAEEYRSIKRPLVVNALGAQKKDIPRANLILITSSVPGEGKTYTSINLALSIAAELDKKVLLVDADVAKPSISKILGITQTPGLIEYLEGDVDSLSEVILRTEIDGLRIIPAGKRHKYSTELLASNRMSGLAKELSERYSDRIVIFDTPPLLATTQAEVLASLVGQVVLVIAAESTSQTIVTESVKKLESCNDVVLALLNKTERSFDAGYYGYGHY